MRRWVRERVAAAGESEPVNLYAELLALTEPPILAEVLQLVDGNRLAASRWLGLARATVRKMIARHLPEFAPNDDDNAKIGDDDLPGDNLSRPRLD